jgi:fatty-acyl-CoA synthase/long-chain acyl-CoA synthetase
MAVEVTVKRALELAAAAGRARPALHGPGGTMSYAALDAAANRLANHLLAFCEPADRVAIMLSNGPEYVVAAFACAKARLTMLPVNYRFTAAEVAFLFDDATPRAVVHGAEFRPQIAQAASGRAGLRRLVLGAAEAGETDLREVLDHGDSRPLPGTARASDIFYLGYTSGTTGRPKGAIVTQGNRALAYHYWALEFGLTQDDHGLHCGPFHHTAPFTFSLTQLFMRGQVSILPAFSPRAALETIARNRVTWAFMVPFMLERLLELDPAEIAAHDLSSLRMIVSGASPLSTRTKERLLEILKGAELHEFYGATEAGVITNLQPRDQRRKTRCVGRPVFDTEIAIRRPDRTAVEPGEPGDIWLRGPTLFSGYFNAPEKTAEVFDGDWCTLGDVGRIDDEGYLYIVDRSKDVIKSGGVNIYPVEIEEALLGHPAVADVAVVGIPDETWGEAVHAVVVPQHADQATSDVLLGHCRERLAGYKLPKSFEYRSELPRNANGKVLKRVLRSDAQARAQSLMS